MPDIVNLPLGYMNGCIVSIASSTTLNISPGELRDSQNNYDIIFNSPISISINNIGLNGLDTGTIAHTLYNVFVIYSSSGFNPIGGIISLSTTPVLPLGYDLFRQVGFCVINASSHLSIIYQSGISNDRSFAFDTLPEINTFAGITTFTPLSFNGHVPYLPNISITLLTIFLPSAAGNTFNLRPTGSSSTEGIKMYGTTNAIHETAMVTMTPIYAGGNISIDAKVQNAGDNLQIYLSSVQLSL